MDVYGNFDFQNVGSLVRAAIGQDTTFPSAAETIAGRLAFFNKRVWIAADIVGGFPSWIPLTNEIDAFQHIQSSASTTWTIIHNLNSGSPIVQVYDDTGVLITPTAVVPGDANQVTLTFASGITGRAIVLSGNFEGNSKTEITTSIEYTQTVAATSWVVSHGLGRYPIVRVFTDDVPPQEIQPLSIVHDSNMQVTINFSTARAGTARLI